MRMCLRALVVVWFTHSHREVISFLNQSPHKSVIFKKINMNVHERLHIKAIDSHIDFDFWNS